MVPVTRFFFQQEEGFIAGQRSVPTQEKELDLEKKALRRHVVVDWERGDKNKEHTKANTN